MPWSQNVDHVCNVYEGSEVWSVCVCRSECVTVNWFYSITYHLHYNKRAELNFTLKFILKNCCLKCFLIFFKLNWSLLLFPAVRFGRIPKREKQRLLDEMQSFMNSHNPMDVDSDTPSEALPMDTTPRPQCHQLGSREVIRASSRLPVTVKEEMNLVKINNDDDDPSTASSPSHEFQLHSVPPRITSPPSCPIQGRFTLTHTESTPRHTGSDIKTETPCSWRQSAGAKVLVR